MPQMDMDKLNLDVLSCLPEAKQSPTCWVYQKRETPEGSLVKGSMTMTKHTGSHISRSHYILYILYIKQISCLLKGTLLFCRCDIGQDAPPGHAAHDAVKWEAPSRVGAWLA